LFIINCNLNLSAQSGKKRKNQVEECWPPDDVARVMAWVADAWLSWEIEVLIDSGPSSLAWIVDEI